MIQFSVSSLLCPLAENFLHYRIMWHLSVFQAWGWPQNIPEIGQLTLWKTRPKTTRPRFKRQLALFRNIKKCILLHLMHKSDIIKTDDQKLSEDIRMR